MSTIVAENTVPDLNVPTELVRLLMEIGYVASGRGWQVQSSNIFNGVAAARPSSEYPLVGLAVNYINFGKFTEAAKLLSEKGLKVNPNSGLVKAFLAIAVKELGGGVEAIALMQDVVASSDDLAAVNLAKSFLAGKDIN